jgi:hypothetical protein
MTHRDDDEKKRTMRIKMRRRMRRRVWHSRLDHHPRARPSKIIK